MLVITVNLVTRDVIGPQKSGSGRARAFNFRARAGSGFTRKCPSGLIIQTSGLEILHFESLKAIFTTNTCQSEAYLQAPTRQDII